MDEKTLWAACAAAIAALFGVIMKGKADHLKDVVAGKDAQITTLQGELTTVRAERDKLLNSLEAVMAPAKEPISQRTMPERVHRAEKFIEHATEDMSLSPEDIKRILQKAKKAEQEGGA